MPLSKLYIHEEVISSPLVKKIQSHIDAPFYIVKDAKEVFNDIGSSIDPIKEGKRTLFLTRNKGPFIKNCPGTRSYICCGYKILHIGSYCVMDCSYCILQAYFHPPLLQFFVNHNKMFAQLRDIFNQKEIQRIGTGEFTDSMIWDKWTNLSKVLIPMFARQTCCVLELKTKTVNIKRLEDLDHNQKTILSWSLNTQRIIDDEERKTASLSARLKAAAACESWGYPLSFHFDPLFIYKGCEKDYKEVIRALFSHVSWENIVWISLGSFRFMGSLKPIIQKRFSRSKIIYGEFIPGMDGKMRYFKPLRVDLYRKIVNWIKEAAPGVLVYFCMEDNEVWEKSLGFTPDQYGGLSRLLDQSAAKHCNLC